MPFKLLTLNGSWYYHPATDLISFLMVIVITFLVEFAFIGSYVVDKEKQEISMLTLFLIIISANVVTGFIGWWILNAI